MAGGSSFTTETSLEELLDDGGHDDDDIHLICGCLPTLTHCGTYQPDVTAVDLVSIDEKFCANCLKVWNTRGCGRCSCRPGAICQACLRSAANRS